MKRQGKQKIIAVVAIVFFGLGIEVSRIESSSRHEQ